MANRLADAVLVSWYVLNSIKPRYTGSKDTDGLAASMLRDLMRDYELSDYGSKEKNLNRFMSHIGKCYDM